MTKLKTKPEKDIGSREAAEKAMLELGCIESDLAAIVAKAEKEISQVRARFCEGPVAEERKRLEEQKKAITKDLEKFAKTDCKNWFAKSLDLPSGSLGFRHSPPSVALVKSIAKSIDTALINLQASCQRYVRKTSTINKELIVQDFIGNKLDAQKLYTCGLDIVRKKSFFIRTDFTEALEKAQDKLKKA